MTEAVTIPMLPGQIAVTVPDGDGFRTFVIDPDQRGGADAYHAAWQLGRLFNQVADRQATENVVDLDGED